MTNPADPSRAELNEAQREVVDKLGARVDERPTFPDGLALGLRSLIEDELAPTASALADGERLFVNKHVLSQVLACEARHVHEQTQPFSWSVPTARGTVAHRAIEYSVHWRTRPVANELVDEAMAALTNDGSSLAQFLAHLPEADRAQLRGEAANATQAFLDGFPPLRYRANWRPSVEVRGRYEVAEGRILLSGKVDLSLGGPDGDLSGRVFIDLKSGRRHRQHTDDLRFYALVETMRYGTPPRMVATYYLEESRLSSEQITAEVLWAAAARVVDGVKRHAELMAAPASAQRLTGPACMWCPLIDSCDDGRRFLDADNEDDFDALR